MMLKKVLSAFLLITSLSAGEPVVVPPTSKEIQIEQTLSIIKPDAVENNQIGEIIEYIETSGLKIVGSKMIRLSTEQAKHLYAAHKDAAFFNDLVTFITSGPVIVQVLEGEDAVAVNRQLMGVTDPAKASPGTIRSDFGTDAQKNAVHGSDSLSSAKKEIAIFFKPQEIFSHAAPSAL